jgi:RNA-binding protein YhbY
MAKIPIGNVQLGKQGVTDNFVESIRNNFKNHENVKVSVLKSATRNREGLKKVSEELLEKLGKNFTARIIGFTIVLKKWRREVR